ncbi:MAG: molybdenum cofactor biosynthesis protein [Nitrospiraceae bacterium]|nr:molybdenum cofactor biosynthesis protein [Nitrospiraceae bacterium]
MQYTAGVLTVSDSAARGERVDGSGPLISHLLEQYNYRVILQKIVPDEEEDIRGILIKWIDEVALDVILTTGGTGLTPRDVTPEATRSVITQEVPGITEAIRIKGLDFTPRAMLSRGVSGVRGETLIINLPGSPRAVKQGMEIVVPIIRHALDKIKGDPSPCL